MLHHLMLLIPHYQTLVVQLHLTTLVQNNPTLLARSSSNIDYSAGSVSTKRDSFSLIKADSTIYVILRGGEGLFDISDLCLAIIWRLNGLKAASNTKKDMPLQHHPLSFSTFTLKGTWQYAHIPVGRNQTPCLQQTGSPSADCEQPSTGVEIQPHSRTNINSRGTV